LGRRSGYLWRRCSLCYRMLIRTWRSASRRQMVGFDRGQFNALQRLVSAAWACFDIRRSMNKLETVLAEYHEHLAPRRLPGVQHVGVPGSADHLQAMCSKDGTTTTTHRCNLWAWGAGHIPVHDSDIEIFKSNRSTTRKRQSVAIRLTPSLRKQFWWGSGLELLDYRHRFFAG
jgi:hypothetical protein